MRFGDQDRASRFLAAGVLGLVVTAVAGFIAGPSPAQKPKEGGAEADREKLQGTWTVTKYYGGQSERPLPKKPAVFKGEKLEFPTLADGMTFKLDPSKSPKQIDIVPTSGADKGEVYPGLYELEKDTLKLAVVARAGADRPTAFESKKRADPALYFVLTREK
jgi:uncharacterized protein (TIGR03067 family)